MRRHALQTVSTKWAQLSPSPHVAGVQEPSTATQFAITAYTLWRLPLEAVAQVWAREGSRGIPFPVCLERNRSCYHCWGIEPPQKWAERGGGAQ